MSDLAQHLSLLLLVYPIYLLMMAGVLAICGVPRKEIAKWAIRQAGRQRATDLIRAARGLDTLQDAQPAVEEAKATES